MTKRLYRQPATEVVTADVSAALMAGSLTNEAETETTGVFEDDNIGTIIGLSRQFGE